MIHETNEIPILTEDFKYRLFIMFGTSLMAMNAIVVLYRITKQFNRYGSTDRKLDIALEFIATAVFLAMDASYLVLTYVPGIYSTIAVQLTFLAIHLEPVFAIYMTLILLYQWFPDPFELYRSYIGGLFGFIIGVPYIVTLILESQYTFLDVQWVSNMIMCLIQLGNALVFQFVVYYIQSTYPVMVYNERNADIIQQKVINLNVQCAITCVNFLLVIAQPNMMNLILVINLNHIKLILSHRITSHLHEIKRPVISDEFPDLVSQSVMLEPGLVRPRTMSSRTSSLHRTRKHPPTSPIHVRTMPEQEDDDDDDDEDEQPSTYAPVDAFSDISPIFHPNTDNVRGSRLGL